MKARVCGWYTDKAGKTHQPEIRRARNKAKGQVSQEQLSFGVGDTVTDQLLSSRAGTRETNVLNSSFPPALKLLIISMWSKPK